jgi:RNA polymerase sigma-70 factor (ECF subfamily)
LAVAARNGDPDAAGELYRRNQRRARAAARAFCADSDADDAVADGLIRALDRIGQLRDPAAVDAWMIRCVVRAAVDLSRTRRRLWLGGDLEALVERTLPAGPSAAEVVMAGADQAAMAVALRDMPLDQRRLLDLRYRQGLPVAAVAAALGRPPGSVRRQCVAARHAAGQRFLRRHLRPAAGACARVSDVLCQEPYRRPSARARRRVREHLGACRACRDRQAEVRAVLCEVGYRRPPPVE